MPASDQWLRVKQNDTGHHITVSASLKDDPGFTVLKGQDAAVNHNGEPNPPTYRDDKASSSKSTSSNTEKES